MGPRNEHSPTSSHNKCVRESGKEDFKRMLAVNLVGTFLGIKHAA